MPVYYELNKYINSYGTRKNSCLRSHNTSRIHRERFNLNITTLWRNKLDA